MMMAVVATACGWGPEVKGWPQQLSLVFRSDAAVGPLGSVSPDPASFWLLTEQI